MTVSRTPWKMFLSQVLARNGVGLDKTKVVSRHPACSTARKQYQAGASDRVAAMMIEKAVWQTFGP